MIALFQAAFETLLCSVVHQSSVCIVFIHMLFQEIQITRRREVSLLILVMGCDWKSCNEYVHIYHVTPHDIIWTIFL